MSDEMTLGIIGAGSFAAYFVASLRRSGSKAEISVSPRNRRIAEHLAANHGCLIAEDNAAVAKSSKIVLLAVRPPDVVSALSGVQFEPDQTLISAVAGVSCSELKTHAGRVRRIVRIMPAAYIETGLGFFPIYPEDDLVRSFLTPAGIVTSFASEEEFGTALLGACLSGWLYAFFDDLVKTFQKYGISEEVARQLVLANVRGTANYAMETPGRSLQEISDSIATDGTYTLAGLNELLGAVPFSGWRSALDTVEKLRRGAER